MQAQTVHGRGNSQGVVELFIDRWQKSGRLGASSLPCGTANVRALQEVQRGLIEADHLRRVSPGSLAGC